MVKFGCVFVDCGEYGWCGVDVGYVGFYVGLIDCDLGGIDWF